MGWVISWWEEPVKKDVRNVAEVPNEDGANADVHEGEDDNTTQSATDESFILYRL